MRTRMSNCEPVILERSSHAMSRREVDPDALKVLYRLHRNGFKAYLVGGAVRDLLLEKRPKDFDVVTDAHPGQIKKLFGNSYLIGRRFRLVHIRFKGNNIIEVATFRREPDEEDIDQNNTFGSPEEDAFRRDITINGLFYDIANFSIVDYVGGLADIRDKRVRIIGDPHVRYQDDPVRMWRVLRHAVRLQFDIEEATAQAVAVHRERLATCSGARLVEELNKDVKSGHLAPLISKMRDFGILPIIWGTVGEFYVQDSQAFSSLERLLHALDRAIQAGRIPTQELCYALMFWPWAQQRLADMGRGVDRGKELNEVLNAAGLVITIPKSLRAGCLQTIIIVQSMSEALATGKMRWSLKKRSRYADAAQVCVLIEEGDLPRGGEAFEALFARRHAEAGRPRRRRRRRRPKRGTPRET